MQIISELEAVYTGKAKSQTLAQLVKDMNTFKTFMGKEMQKYKNLEELIKIIAENEKSERKIISELYQGQISNALKDLVQMFENETGVNTKKFIINSYNYDKSTMEYYEVDISSLEPRYGEFDPSNNHVIPDDDDKKKSPVVYIVGGIAALIVLILVIYFVSRKKSLKRR